MPLTMNARLRLAAVRVSFGASAVVLGVAEREAAGVEVEAVGEPAVADGVAVALARALRVGLDEPAGSLEGPAPGAAAAQPTKATVSAAAVRVRVKVAGLNPRSCGPDTDAR
jgi:hypothetical protein